MYVTFVVILSNDKVMGKKVEAELREALGLIGEIFFRQIDPAAAQIPYVKGDSVSIVVPDEDKRSKVEDATSGKEFSIKVHVVNKSECVLEDPGAILATLFAFGRDVV